MAEQRGKIPISKLVDELIQVGLYDRHTQARLTILASTYREAGDISRKERMLIERVFANHIDNIKKSGQIRLLSMAGVDKSLFSGEITCAVKEFLGFGNQGPVYSVLVNKQPFALKLYSARELKDVMLAHGSFGLGGILHEVENRGEHTVLTNLGQKVLARKAKGVYARCKKMVRIHSIGVEDDFMYVLMDMLAVDPIHKLDPAKIGGDPVDMASWSADCAIGLCQLHLEERRLHLNIRPEAFIRKNVDKADRLPKYTFFHYPQMYNRRSDSLCFTTKFVMVDHLDNSVEIADKGLKGLGTVGSWLYIPPEAIIQLLKTLRDDYETYVEKRQPFEEVRSVKLKRTQMDDLWALGLTLYEFLSGGKKPYGEPQSLTDMVNSILLTKFDFSPIHPAFRDLLSAILEKEPRRRFQRIMDGCPEKIVSRKVLAEAVLYKLEKIGLECGT
jgi:serine/threonine protein kinase